MVGPDVTTWNFDDWGHLDALMVLREKYKPRVLLGSPEVRLWMTAATPNFAHKTVDMHIVDAANPGLQVWSRACMKQDDEAMI